MSMTSWLQSLLASSQVGHASRARDRRRFQSKHAVSGYVQSLEERQMLSGIALTFDAVDDGQPNDFELRRNGDKVELLRNNQVVRAQSASETTAAVINGVDGLADSLTVDFRTGDLSLVDGIQFRAGDGDRLSVLDSSSADSFNLTGNTISNGSTAISLEGVERILVDVSSGGPDQVQVGLPFSQSGQLPTIQLLG